MTVHNDENVQFQEGEIFIFIAYLIASRSTAFLFRLLLLHYLLSCFNVDNTDVSKYVCIYLYVCLYTVYKLHTRI